LNRRSFEEAVDRHLREGRRYGFGGAVLLLDLDHFKYVNDTLGHNVGDQLLVAVARRLRGRLRDSDLLARLGGDEFAILLPRA
ncbi:GGDEF domain-containing protein, partial [Escherichia coli]|nr:GGDEF domain-containing protein [Escherichia coli]